MCWKTVLVRSVVPVILLFGIVGAAKAAPPTPEQIFPANSVQFCVLSDASRMTDAWLQTFLGRLINDPQMKPYMTDLSTNMRGVNFLLDTIGLEFDTVKAAAGGEIGWGQILDENKHISSVLTVDVSGRPAQANALYTELFKKLSGQGGRYSERILNGDKVLVVSLPNGKEIVYGLKDQVLIISDYLPTVQGMLPRFAGPAPSSLVNVPAFQWVRNKTQSQAGETKFVRWYFDTMGRFEAKKIQYPPVGKKQAAVDVMRGEGLDAFKGTGGAVGFMTNNTDILIRIAAYAPPPYRNAMRMLRFPNESPIAAEPWVPMGCSTYGTVCIDFLNAFDSFDTLFERLVDEEPGTFQKIMKDLKEDADGPKVDVRNEIMAQLGNRLIVLNVSLEPDQQRPERFLYAIPVKDANAEKILAEGIRKAFEPDRRVTKRQVQGLAIWHYEPKQSKKKMANGQPRKTMLPPMDITVAQGYLFITTLPELLDQVLARSNQKSLNDSPEYLRMMSELARLNPGPANSRFFLKLDTGARSTYHMLQTNNLREGVSIYSTILLQLMKKDEEGKALRADGAKLPPYSYAQSFLGNMGISFSSHEDGWSGVLIGIKK
ncbi:MAG TPA: hypothetical protein VKS79_18895 [Gemmataceae bacterium]|nr:hypothetical protein [Gemmataceae bacterium]